MFNQQHSLELSTCLACGSSNLKPTLDLGMQPLANSYRKTTDQLEVVFPLAINRCADCYHVQLTQAVNPELMFNNYLYVSGTSQTMKDHFRWFADFTTEYYMQIFHHESEKVFDIGCNDGSQLDQYKAFGLKTYGIDPAKNLYNISSAKGHKVDVRFFDENYVLDTDENYDIIVAQNVFAHNYDPLKFLKCARRIMNNASLMFIQTSQADMILNNEFDTIYHEHISFYNINSMDKLCRRAGMFLIDVVKCPLHGNSYIFVLSTNDNVSRPAHIQNLIQMERLSGLYTEQTYIDYANNCNSIVNELSIKINKFKEFYKVVGYGAAAKGMTLLNYSKINMDYIIDDNPLKQGLYTPGRNIEICSINRLQEDYGNILFVPLAWNFFEEIKNKIKSNRNNPADRFIKYFPKVELSS